MNILLIIFLIIFTGLLVLLFFKNRKLKFSSLETNSLYESLIGNSPDGIFIACEGKFVYANKKILEITGFTKEDFFSLSASEIIYRTKTEKVSDNYWEVMAGLESNQQCELELVTETGKVIRVDVSFNLIDYKNKKAVFVALRDISKRKELEEKLLRNDQYINNIINGLPNIIVGIDSHANVIFVNNEAEQFMDMKFNKVLGRKIFHILPQFSHQFGYVDEVLNKNSIRDFSMIEIDSDEENYYYHLKLIPFLGNYRKSVLIVITNITGIVKFENIVVAADRIFSSADFLNSFVSNIKKELTGFEKILEEFTDNLKSLGKEDALGEVLADRILKTSKSFSNLKSGFVDIQKSTDILKDYSPSDESSFKRCSLNKILEDSIVIMKSDPYFFNGYNLSNIDFSSEYDSNIPEVFCNPFEIDQAVRKFLKNSLESFQSNGDSKNRNLEIVIKTYENQGYVCISIEDNGDGFNNSIVQSVSSPHFVNSQGSKNSDFGLSVASYIIKNRHKGELEILSKPGSGTKIIIKLRIDK